MKGYRVIAARTRSPHVSTNGLSATRRTSSRPAAPGYPCLCHHLRAQPLWGSLGPRSTVFSSPTPTSFPGRGAAPAPGLCSRPKITRPPADGLRRKTASCRANLAPTKKGRLRLRRPAPQHTPYLRTSPTSGDYTTKPAKVKTSGRITEWKLNWSKPGVA